MWQTVESATPLGRVIAVRTKYGIHLHCMLNKQGELVPWDEQGERWTDGKFDYADVTEWVRLA
jgi:hypothetical protein